MVSDSEPRYRLVDANGNVVGALYAQGDGTLAIQEGTSGSDNEVTVDTDGTFNAPAVSTVNADITDIQTNVETPTDISGSRSLNTWYQNTTAYPLRVAVTISASSSGDDLSNSMYVNDTESSNRIAHNRNQSVGGSSDRLQTEVIVPVDYYYKANVTQDGSLDLWVEQRLGSDMGN